MFFCSRFPHAFSDYCTGTTSQFKALTPLLQTNLLRLTRVCPLQLEHCDPLGWRKALHPIVEAGTPRQSLNENLFHLPLTFCPFPSRYHSAPPQASDPHPADGEGKETRAGASGGEGEEEDEADEGQSSRCCKVKSPRWIRTCMHYSFPASIDPFTSKNPEEYVYLLLPYYSVQTPSLTRCPFIF